MQVLYNNCIVPKGIVPKGIYGKLFAMMNIWHSVDNVQRLNLVVEVGE